ncbi:MAG: RNA-binding transcriptional accessory protein [Ruminococcaceae bacterium]|nr:RNA-binding transcriptional accessory protein [Oscillospiraceae bacterium]
MDILKALQTEFNLRPQQVENTVKLIDEGNTIPFIARYRKEVTGSLDDTVLRDLYDRLKYLRSLDQRRQEVASSIEEQGFMTEELAQKLEKAVTLAEIEDIYRPFKPKRRTRATVAKEKGLEPLALKIYAQDELKLSPLEMAEEFINPDLQVETAEDALAGALDIIAEMISDNADYRKEIRRKTFLSGTVKTKATKEEDSVYSQYYDYEEPVRTCAPHRILAINRGENEEFLSVSISCDEGANVAYLKSKVITNELSSCTQELENTVIDAYKRLIFPSIEREIRNDLTEKASEQAIKMFALNLKNLIMQPPLKGKVVLGLDPAYRTGCKLAVVDETGKVLETSVIYPTPPQSKIEEANKKVTDMILRHDIDVIAIGNGTASKESEIFVANLIKTLSKPVSYIVVSESGASVYSASKLGAEEFPEYDVSLRSAVSIARRLQDPLAELVKIDPRSIGVGQYQHDIKGARLSESLAGVVENCVNNVGVDVNTASYSLLSYVAGINSAIAKNIVAYREENGKFTSRKQLLKVKKLGEKAFLQCAGFLRIPDSDNVLDNTAVHPESYEAAKSVISELSIDLASGNLSALENADIPSLAEKCQVGIPTMTDIVEEMKKPGRDIRDSLPPVVLRSDILDMKDLTEGMVLTGTVRNVIDFGAFVDIGVHQDGLVHISEIADRYIKHPSDVLSVGDIVSVRVLSVDLNKKRISLSLKMPKEGKTLV